MDKFLAAKIQHREHREWLEQLNFYQDEIRIFQNELLNVLNAHAHDFPKLEHIQEYRGILLTKLKSIDDFRHQIMIHESQLLPEYRERFQEDFVAHNQLRQNMQTFTKAYDAFKQNFRRFVAHND